MIPGSNSTASFYYGDTKAGTPTITAAGTGLTSATQTATITALPGTKLGISTFSAGASASADDFLHGGRRGRVLKPLHQGDGDHDQLCPPSCTGTHEFAATSGAAAVTTVTLGANAASVTAYYGDTLAGTPIITATATGLNPGTQTETITGGTGTKLAITSSAFSGGASTLATSAFTVTLEDAFGNATAKTTVTTVNLSTTDTTSGTFAAASGGATVSSVSLPANASSVTRLITATPRRGPRPSLQLPRV